MRSPLMSMDELLQELRRILGRALDVSPAAVPVDQPLRELGLDSVGALRILSEAGERLGREIPVTTVWDYPTLSALARHLVGPANATPSADPAVRGEPLAVVGAAFRFPGANDFDELWRLLASGDDTTGPWPTDRGFPSGDWDFPLRGGFVGDVALFDARFFGLSEREARQVDPQQRMVLETAWRCLEDAGLRADEVDGQTIGAFLGISTSDYASAQLGSPDCISPYVATGSAASLAANRLSYFLNLQGPSLSIDTACSSSLVALHHAVRSVRDGECEAAFAGGVNLILRPETSAALHEAGMLADDGRCKTFDDRANGYARGEGCGLVLLKRLSAALRDGDRIRAIIRGSATNHDGRTNGLSAPSGLAQQRVIRAALADAGLAPDAIHMVEAHGTGTRLGDPIEVAALAAVFGRGRIQQAPLRVGSIKANIGHLEAAAGIAGFIKAIACLEHRLMPPQASFQRINPLLDCCDGRISILAETAAPESGDTMRIGVSSFGFGGANAHVVLEQAPRWRPEDASPPRADGVLAVSARTPGALVDSLRAWSRFVEDNPGIGVREIAAEAALRRSHLGVRASIPFGGRTELLAGLSQALAAWEARTVEARSEPGRPLFLFGDQPDGCQQVLQELFETEDRFRDALLDCEARLHQRRGTTIIDALYSDDDTGADVRAALFVAGQWSWSQLWRSWGIEPGGVVGRGLGELAAAAVAGALPIETALMAACGEAAGIASLTDPVCRIDFLAGSSGRMWRTGEAIPGRDAKQLARQVEICRSTPTFPAGGTAIGLTPVLSDHDPMPSGCRRHHKITDLNLARFHRTVLADLYADGVPVDWGGYFGPRRRPLPGAPGYPWERRRYWAFPDKAPAPAPREVTPGTESYFGERWIDIGSIPSVPGGDPGSWRVLGTGPLSRACADHLQAIGATVAHSEDEGFGAVAGKHTTGILVVVEGGTEEGLGAAPARAGERLAALFRSIAAIGPGVRPVLVTRGGCPGTERPAMWRPFSSLVAGACRSAFIELRDRAALHLDLPPAPDANDAAHAIATALSPLSGEDQVAIRAGRLLAQRVVSQPGWTGASYAADPDAAYVISGGLGHVGAMAAEWLVSAGAMELHLIGRSGLPPPNLEARFAIWRARGVQVDCHAIDLGRSDRRRKLEHLCRTRIAGVVHAAGERIAGRVEDLDVGAMDRLIECKVGGAVDLLEILRPTDFHISVTSISGCWGADGLVAYGAVNHLLDEWASEKALGGLPTRILSLGPVAGGGMVTPEDADAMARLGLGTLRPAELMRALDRSAGGSEPRVVAASVEPRFFAAMSGQRGLKRFEAVTTRPRVPPPPAADVTALAGRSIRDQIRERVARLIGEDGEGVDWTLGFFELGLDSRTLMDLRDDLSRQFGIDVPANAVFDHPTLHDIALFIETAAKPPAAKDLASTDVLHATRKNADV